MSKKKKRKKKPIKELHSHEIFDAVQKIDKDIFDAIKVGKILLPHGDIRWMVDCYYNLQEYRKSAANQTRALEESDEPFSFVEWLSRQQATLEAQIHKGLDAWTELDPTSVWAKSLYGVGPVITGGLKAHVDITRCKYAGQLWRYAGVDPGCIWYGAEAAKQIVTDFLGEDRKVKAAQVAGMTDRIAEFFLEATGSPIDDEEATGKILEIVRKALGKRKALVECDQKYIQERISFELQHIRAETEEKTRRRAAGDIAKAVKLRYSENSKAPTEDQVRQLAEQINRNQLTILKFARTEKGKITRSQLEKSISRRPYNARLKVLVWKIGQCFMKFSNHPDCFYGQRLYKPKKAEEQAKNERGEFAEQAAEGAKRVRKDTEAYKWYSKGLLPPGQIDARARRFAAKIFLAHWHRVEYNNHYGKEPPLPYVVEHLGHADLIAPPNWKTPHGDSDWTALETA